MHVKNFVKYIFGKRPKPATFNMMVPSDSQSFVGGDSAAVAAVAVAGGGAAAAAAAAAAASAAMAAEENPMDAQASLAHHYHSQLAKMHQPVKIIHKEHDAISAFCINKVSTGLMAIATQKELQELNISLLLNPTTWNEGMNDEADFDVLNLNE